MPHKKQTFTLAHDLTVYPYLNLHSLSSCDTHNFLSSSFFSLVVYFTVRKLHSTNFAVDRQRTQKVYLKLLEFFPQDEAV